MNKIESWKTGEDAPDGWVKKDVYIENIHWGGKMCRYVILHYPDGSSVGGFEGYEDELPEGTVEMPKQDISAMFEEKVKQIQNGV